MSTRQLQKWACPRRILLATNLVDLGFILPVTIQQALAYKATARHIPCIDAEHVRIGKLQGFLFQISTAFASSYPSAATRAGMACNGLNVHTRAVGKHLQEFGLHGLRQPHIFFFAVLGS